jgi:hypothetical protein
LGRDQGSHEGAGKDAAAGNPDRCGHRSGREVGQRTGLKSESLIPDRDNTESP